MQHCGGKYSVSLRTVLRLRAGQLQDLLEVINGKEALRSHAPERSTIAPSGILQPKQHPQGSVIPLRIFRHFASPSAAVRSSLKVLRARK